MRHKRCREILSSSDRRFASARHPSPDCDREHTHAIIVILIVALPAVALAMRGAARGALATRFVWLSGIAYLLYNAILCRPDSACLQRGAVRRARGDRRGAGHRVPLLASDRNRLLQLSDHLLSADGKPLRGSCFVLSHQLRYLRVP